MFLFSVINFLTTKILNYRLVGDKVSRGEKFLFTSTTVDNWNYNFLGLILIGQACNSSPQIGISLFSMAPVKPHEKMILIVYPDPEYRDRKRLREQFEVSIYKTFRAKSFN